MTRIRRIGVLTSGGDCAGLDAVIRAITYRAVDGYGWDVVGIRNGTAGRLDRMVAWSGRQVMDVPLAEAIGTSRDVDVAGPLVHTARGLGICLGDA